MYKKLIKSLFHNHKVFKYFNASLFLNVLNTSFRLLQVYVFTAFFSENDYALWITLFSILAFYSLVDFGISNYLSNHLLKIDILNNKKYFMSYFNFGKKIINTSIILFVIFSFLLFEVLDFYSYLNLNNFQNQNYKIIFIILFVGIIIQIYAGFYFSIIRSINLMDKALQINSIYIFLQLISFIFVSYFFKSLLITSIFYIIPYVLLLFHYKKYLKNKIFNFPSIKIITLKYKEILIGSFAFLIISINHNFLNFIPIYFLNIFSSKQSLIDFFIYKSFVLFLIQFINIFYFSYSPIINRSFYERSADFYTILKKLFFISLLIFIFFLIVSYIYGEVFFKIWTNNETFFDIKIMSIFYIFIFNRIIWIYLFNIFQSLNFVLISSILYFCFNLCYFIFLYNVNLPSELDLFIPFIVFPELILSIIFIAYFLFAIKYKIS